MTREKCFGWVSSVALQFLALGALGVSPLMSYDDLPEPHNAIPIRDYVPVIEIPSAPVAPRRAEATPGKAPSPVAIPRGFVAPSVIPIEILPETGLFDEVPEGIPFGTSSGVPGSTGDAPALKNEEAPPPPEPVRVGGKITAPRKRHHVNPAYPPVAVAARVQGIVVLEATIDENGNVVNARILLSIPLLDGAALEAVRQWSYEPTLLNGSPVPILMSVSVRFELGR